MSLFFMFVNGGRLEGMAGRCISLLDFLSSEPSEHTPSPITVPSVSAVFVEITPRSDAPEQELMTVGYHSSVLLCY